MVTGDNRWIINHYRNGWIIGKQKPLHLRIPAANREKTVTGISRLHSHTTNQHQSLVKIGRRAVNSTINSLWYVREPNKNYSLEWWKYSRIWKLKENNQLLLFFSFNDLNTIDVEASTSLKKRICRSALDFIKETFQSMWTRTITEMFLKCELLLRSKQ